MKKLTTEEKAAKKKKYYELHKKEINEKHRVYYEANKEKLKNKRKEYYKENLEIILEYQKEYYKEYCEEKLEYQKEYYRNNITSIREQRREYRKERKKLDIKFKLLCNLRRRLNLAVNKTSKSKSTMELVGCTIEELLIHLESKFVEGMNFENYGEWHVDHIRPCASFNLLNEEEQKACFHYSNLQPLWAEDNIKKGDKWDENTKAVNS